MAVRRTGAGAATYQAHNTYTVDDGQVGIVHGTRNVLPECKRIAAKETQHNIHMQMHKQKNAVATNSAMQEYEGRTIYIYIAAAETRNFC